jgi:hypothetical protein
VLDRTHEREYRSAEEFAELFRELFLDFSLHTDRFRFSPARFGYRLLTKLGLIRQPNPEFFAKTRMGRMLQKWQVSIPRYKHITVVVEN